MNMYLFDVLKSEDISSLAQLDKLYQEAVKTYNTTKHSGIGCTPRQRYEAAPSVTKHVDVNVLNTDFMNRKERKVKKDNTLKIFNTWFDVPEGFADRKVEVRYIPGTTEGMCIYYNGKRYPIKETDPVKNCHTPRKARNPIPARKGVRPDKSTKEPAKSESKDKSVSSEPVRKTSSAPSVFAAKEQDVAKGKGSSKRKGG